MNPNQQRVHIDAPLTNMSVAYIQDAKTFIAPSIFPIVPVDKASDVYYVFGKEAWFRDDAEERAVGTKAASSGYELSQDKYSCTEYAFRHPLYDRVRQNADTPILNLERNAVNLATRKGLLKLERLFVSKFFKTGVWSKDVTGVASNPDANQVVKWSDYANSELVKNVDAGKTHVIQTTGFEPNTMVVGLEAHNAIKEHPVILDKIKYTQRGVVTEDLIAQVFGVERYFVAKSIINTAKEGAAANMQFNFGKGALLMYVNPEPAPEMPSAGYTFAWTGVSAGLGENVGVRTYREEAVRANWYEMEMSVDLKKVGGDLGYFFDQIVD
jgi:hypothetical protein